MDIRNWMRKGVSASASASSRSTTSTDRDAPPSVAQPSQLPTSSLTSWIPAKVRAVDGSANERLQLSDLGHLSPAQPVLKQFPKRKLTQSDCFRSFVGSLYRGREWLEYSVEADAAFYFPCRKFGGSDSTFTTVGYTNWKTCYRQN